MKDQIGKMLQWLVWCSEYRTQNMIDEYMNEQNEKKKGADYIERVFKILEQVSDKCFSWFKKNCFTERSFYINEPRT